MANRILLKQTATSTLLVLSVLLQAALVWEQGIAAPAKRNDILAGTEFLSVFINGAMAPTPHRRRGSRRGVPLTDHVPSESRQQEASIYRISRTSHTMPMVDSAHNLPSEEDVRFYPIRQKSSENSQNLASLIDDLSTVSEITSKLTPQTEAPAPAQINQSNSKTNKSVNQKVIGVSVTSTVEATPYKVRVEHYDADEKTAITRLVAMSPSTASTTTTTKTAATSTTPLPALLVTEELSNIVSESNRSEFSVEEGSPKTSWRGRSRVTQRPASRRSFHSSHRHHKKEMNDFAEKSDPEPVEDGYEVPEQSSEVREDHQEPTEVPEHPHHGRKAGRHYEVSSYSQPSKIYSQPSKLYSKPARVYSEPAKVYSEPAKIYSEPEKVYSEPAKVYSEPAKIYSEPEKVYSEPAKVYSEPAKIYSEPAKVYSEPAKVYSEPAKIYGEPEKIYSEPSKVYSEPAKIYSEPAKVYSEPAKVYGEPSKVYGPNGHPLEPEEPEEPEEENYEVDEAVSVGSNGNAHGPQTVTEDGHKVGYVVEGRNYRKYRVEERTPDGFIVGEYGVVSHDDGSLRGVRYTADGTINPRLIYDALMKFLAL